MDTQLDVQEASQIEIADLLTKLHTSENGLSSIDAKDRLVKFGGNKISGEKRLGVLYEFLSNFKNPLVLILLAAAIVSFFLGEVVDGLIIAFIVLMSAVLNFLQEYSAGKAAKKLQERVETKATVIRDGSKIEVPIAQLVRGDIIFLSSGDLVPSDARVISSKDFFVNQSSLTGESFPVEKTSEVVQKSSSLSEMTDILFLGTNVVSGSATAVVVATGEQTEYGKIAKNISSPNLETEFTKGIKGFSFLIMRATIFFVLLIFIITIFFKHTNIFESFTFAIAIAVGLTPELLPMIMSVTMAKGSVSMARKGVIVKKLSAIPNFGSMDILCTDKTGTLTQDKIELVKYTDLFGNDSESVFLHAYLNSLHQTGIRNPMDEAVLSFKTIHTSEYKKVDEIPFDFVRKKMSVVVENSAKRLLITKGAPEEVLKSSEHYLDKGKSHLLTPHMQKSVLDTYHEFSKSGHRVLAIAVKELERKQRRYTKSDEEHMELIGFVAFLDPAKHGVKEVLTQLQTMGIEVKVLTGDNELVTKKICEDVGLSVKGILIGYDIESLTDDALRVAAEKTTIFARFSPSQKNRVISALQKNNHVVGYVGDGINDAPSLKTADVGISVDNAVDVAKESADMILTHKSLKELGDGVLEGRKTFGNTMKYIQMGISSNFGNMFSVLGAVLFLPFLPMLPIQILLNNFIYDFSQITIPTDSVDEEYILSPKRWDSGFIRRFMIIFGSVSSLFDFVTFFVLYSIFKATPALFQTGWFLESLATQTLVIYIIRTRRIPFLQSMPSNYLLLSTLGAVILACGLIYLPVGSFFSFVPLPIPIVLTIICIVAIYLCVVEIGKRMFYQRFTTY